MPQPCHASPCLPCLRFELLPPPGSLPCPLSLICPRPSTPSPGMRLGADSASHRPGHEPQNMGTKSVMDRGCRSYLVVCFCSRKPKIMGEIKLRRLHHTEAGGRQIQGGVTCPVPGAWIPPCPHHHPTGCSQEFQRKEEGGGGVLASPVGRLPGVCTDPLSLHRTSQCLV